MLARFNFDKTKFIIFAIILILFGIFLGMNSTSVDIWIFGWTPSMPLIFLLSGVFVFGCLCGYGTAVWLRHRHESDEI
jgi:uncharacterized integral membrane protein